MNDKHDPNGSVPIGTFTATTEGGEFEIPIEIVSDEDVEPSQLAIQSEPTRAYDDHTPAEVPRRKRVQTLMGVALPGATLSALPTVPAAHDPTKATNREINAAIDDVLDEDRPTSIYGFKRDSGGLKALETMLEDQLIEIPSSPPGEIVGVVGRSSDTGTYEIELREDSEPEIRRSVPVLAPAQFVEARARDAGASARSVPQPTAAGDGAGLPRREPDDVRAAAPSPTPALRPAAATASPASRPAAVSGDAVSRAAATSGAGSRAREPEREVAKKVAPVSSLAPTEIPRPRARPDAARPKGPALQVGYYLVAAMVLLGIGGWWMTSGSYRRMDESASQPMAAANVAKPSAPDPLASPKLPAEAAPAPATEPTPAPPTLAQEPEDSIPAVTREAKVRSKPRVAAKSVKPAPAVGPAPDGLAETPSRDDVRVSLDRVRSSVQACAEGRNGVAEVDVTIARNGNVTNALVGGDFGGTPQGSCIARAVRRAKFPEFKQDRYRVLFPYVL
jgi:hypothetical protein